MWIGVSSVTIFTLLIRTMLDQNLIVGLIVLAVVILAVYAYAPKLKGLLSGVGRYEGFASNQVNGKSQGQGQVVKPSHATAGGTMGGNAMPTAGAVAKNAAHVAGHEGFVGDNMAAVPMEAANKPQGCYPREQLNPMELLPSDPNSQWAQVNPTGAGDIQGKNFLSAGALIGINTIGQSLRNANLQLRAEPPNPQVQVSPWQQSTIEPDLTRKPLE
jgi:hypothetical protein